MIETIKSSIEYAVYHYRGCKKSPKKGPKNGAKTTYIYNALNQLTAETGVTYQYDDAGNLIYATSNEKSTLYAYNAENKLIRATVQEGNGVSVEEYEYDYAGNRTVKKSENDYTYYLNDVSSSLTQVLAELDSNGNEKCYYIRGTEIISQERNGTISYYLTDGHGSVRQLADSTGAVTDTYVYDAWGNLISSTGNTENSYLYCGEQLDSTTGLYYLRARYMNPTTGTFTTMDTYQGSIFEPVSLHKYLYANANPITYSDPSGYCVLAAKWEYNTSIVRKGMELISQLKGLAIVVSNTISSVITAELLEGILIGGCGALAAISDIILFDALLSVNSQVVSFVTGLSAIDIEAEKDNILKQKYVYVYLLCDRGTENVMYVGIASDPKWREEQHKRDERKTTDGVPWRMDVIIKAKNRIQARMIEEALITAFTIEKLANARHEIRSGRVQSETKFNQEIDAVRNLLNNIAEEDLMWLIA